MAAHRPPRQRPARARPALIGLLGGESTGKTSLAAALAAELPALIARDMLREHVAAGGTLSAAADQPARMRAQADEVRRVRAAADEAGSAIAGVIADPMPIMTAVYSLVYFDDASLLPAGLADAADYDLVVWCAPDIPWAAEPGMRDGPHRRAEAHAVIADLIVPRLESVVPVSGPLPLRCASVRRALLRA